VFVFLAARVGRIYPDPDGTVGNYLTKGNVGRNVPLMTSVWYLAGPKNGMREEASMAQIGSICPDARLDQAANRRGVVGARYDEMTVCLRQSFSGLRLTSNALEKVIRLLPPSERRETLFSELSQLDRIMAELQVDIDGYVDAASDESPN